MTIIKTTKQKITKNNNNNGNNKNNKTKNNKNNNNNNYELDVLHHNTDHPHASVPQLMVPAFLSFFFLDSASSLDGGPAPSDGLSNMKCVP